MEYRKIISFGKGSYVISVPKSWIKKNKLKKGDAVSVGEELSGLLISPSEKEKPEISVKTITAEDLPLSYTSTEIVTAYINGYDTIEIVSKNLSEKALKIKEVIRNLAGMEIMEQTAKRIVAKNLINIKDVSLPDIIRRMDIITRGMIEDTIECKEQNTCTNLIQRDVDVNRLQFLCSRIVLAGLRNPGVARMIKHTPLELVGLKSIADKIEKIADRQKRIARYLTQSKMLPNSKKELDILIGYMKDRYYKVMKAYYTHDTGIAYDINITSGEAILECDKFLLNNSGCKLCEKTKRTCYGTNTCVLLASIVENIKGMATSIKLLARTILEETSDSSMGFQI